MADDWKQGILDYLASSYRFPLAVSLGVGALAPFRYCRSFPASAREWTPDSSSWRPSAFRWR